MKIWLIRAGAHGEYEQRFLQDNRVYLTWDHLAYDLSNLTDREDLFQLMERTYPDRKTNTLQNWVNQDIRSTISTFSGRLWRFRIRHPAAVRASKI